MRPDEREVDPFLQRRQKLVEHIRAGQVSRVETNPGPSETPKLFGQAVDWLNSFLKLVDIAGNDHATGDNDGALVQSLHQLSRIEEQASRLSTLRPNVTTNRAVVALVADLAGISDAYLSALSAESMVDAQKAGERGQKLIDSAEATARALVEKVDRHQQLREADEERPEVFLAAMIATTLRIYGCRDLFDLGSPAAVLFQRVTGSGEPPSELSAGLVMTALQFEWLFDEERFWSMAIEVYEALMDKQSRFRRLAQSSKWIGGFQTAIQSSTDAGVAASASVQAAFSERLEVKALLRLGKEILEGPGRFFLATLLHALDDRDFTSVVSEDANKVKKAVASLAWARFSDGLDRTIRNADAHNEYVICSDRVDFTGRTREFNSLTFEELIDRVLCGIESMRAIHLAVVCAASVSGVSLGELDPLPSLDLGPEATAAVVLPLLGWEECAVSLDGDELKVRGRAEPAGANHLSVVAGLCVYLPDSIKSVELRASTGDDADETLDGPLHAIRQWQDDPEGPLAKEIRYVEVCHAWRLNGERIFNRTTVRKWSATTLIRLMATDRDASHSISEIKLVRNLGHDVGDKELADLAKTCSALVRFRDIGPLVTGDAVDVDTTMAKLKDWIGTR